MTGTRTLARDEPGQDAPAGLLAAAALGSAGLLFLGRRRLLRRRDGP